MGAETQAKTRPIPFSDSMVRAILDGRKTMTRRIVKAPKHMTLHGRQPHWDGAWVDPGGTIFGPGPYLKLPYGGGDYEEPDAVEPRIYCPYGYPEYGDRLWVRETWGLQEALRVGECGGDQWETEDYAGRAPAEPIRERDRRVFPVYRANGDECGRWRSPRFMPRWASRITLEVTGVKVERLQDITDEDALAEGIDEGSELFNAYAPDYDLYLKDAFQRLWESIHGKGSWEVNPWLWCVSFRRVD